MFKKKENKRIKKELETIQKEERASRNQRKHWIIW